MIVSERKSWEEILSFLEGEKNIFLLVCGGCSEACETGGPEGLREAKDRLREAGKKVTAAVLIDFVCNKVLVGMRLNRYIDELKSSDSILVVSCGIGVQAVANMVDIPVQPADNTIHMGGFPGVWPGEERCFQCGDCRLADTGGICPYANCPKFLVNGACGGSDKGKCETDPEKDCVWTLIYERLKDLGKLENLRKIRSPRDYNLMLAPAERKKSMFWALETVEEKPKEEVSVSSE
ncbi:MAG: methylenetetrahydrofolate reductase C-terminal domain-containing protein [Candidatus Aerophobetes bacterium]